MMMEKRNGDVTINDGVTTGDDDGDGDLSKRQRIDEHPGIIPPACATLPMATSAASTLNHQQQQHSVNCAQSSSSNTVTALVIQTRGGGGEVGGEHPQQPPPPINNDNIVPSSSFHRISLSPPGTTMPQPRPTITAARAAAAASSPSPFDSQQCGNHVDTMCPKTTSMITSSLTTTSTSRLASSFASSTSGTSSNNNSMHSVACLENKNSPVLASSILREKRNDFVVAQQEGRHFHSKLARVVKQYYMMLVFVAVLLVGGVYTIQQPHQHGERMIPPPPPASSWTRWFLPSWQKSTNRQQQQQATLFPRRPAIPPVMTLRDFLSHHEGFSLAMAPAFFGFYGYFGALAAWEDGISTSLLRGSDDSSRLLQHVSGASAGAMAAVLLAAGVAPKRAAEFCETITISKFSDFPGFGAIFRGNKFERIMYDFLLSEIQQQQQGQDDDMITTTTNSSTTTMSRVAVESLLLLQNARVPVAVTALDIETMQTRILTRGSMARAARASATFPFLFQPVGWVDDENEHDDDASCNNNNKNKNQKKLDATLIDGGIRDHAGVDGLKAFVEMMDDDDVDNNHCSRHRRSSIPPPRRIVQLAVGGFLLDKPPEPGYIVPSADQVVSISIHNLPMCGPWPSGLRNGPIAVQAAYRAMMAALDTPLHYRQQQASNNKNDNHANDDDNYNDDKSIPVHYELQLDATPFWKSS